MGIESTQGQRGDVGWVGSVLRVRAGRRDTKVLLLLSFIPSSSFFFLKIFFFDVDHFLSIEFVTILLLF